MTDPRQGQDPQREDVERDDPALDAETIRDLEPDEQDEERLKGGFRSSGCPL